MAVGEFYVRKGGAHPGQGSGGRSGGVRRGASAVEKGGAHPSDAPIPRLHAMPPAQRTRGAQRPFRGAGAPAGPFPPLFGGGGSVRLGAAPLRGVELPLAAGGRGGRFVGAIPGSVCALGPPRNLTSEGGRGCSRRLTLRGGRLILSSQPSLLLCSPLCRWSDAPRTPSSAPGAWSHLAQTQVLMRSSAACLQGKRFGYLPHLTCDQTQ